MQAGRSWLLLTVALALVLGGCAPHEHLHVYGRVLDVTERAEGSPIEGAGVWAVSLEGAPIRRLGTSGRGGAYEVEIPPGEQEGGLGVRHAGYRAEWWPIGRLSRSERRAHTVELELPIVRSSAPPGRPRAGRPFAE